VSVVEDKQLRDRVRRLDALLQEVDQCQDPDARARFKEIIETLMALHGAAIEEILNRVADTGEGGLAVIDDLAANDLVSSVLLLYGLHPLDLETRVRQALDKVRPYLQSHGGNVELLAIADGVVHLRLQGSCHGCPSSAQTLKSAIEEAIFEKAPDVVAIKAEGATSVEQRPPSARKWTECELPIGNGQAGLPLPVLRQ
jgi:Fe-S cluster biogenesis protein NfuA